MGTREGSCFVLAVETPACELWQWCCNSTGKWNIEAKKPIAGTERCASSAPVELRNGNVAMIVPHGLSSLSRLWAVEIDLARGTQANITYPGKVTVPTFSGLFPYGSAHDEFLFAFVALMNPLVFKRSSDGGWTRNGTWSRPTHPYAVSKVDGGFAVVDRGFINLLNTSVFKSNVNGKNYPPSSMELPIIESCDIKWGYENAVPPVVFKHSESWVQLVLGEQTATLVIWNTKSRSWSPNKTIHNFNTTLGYIPNPPLELPDGRILLQGVNSDRANILCWLPRPDSIDLKFAELKCSVLSGTFCTGANCQVLATFAANHSIVFLENLMQGQVLAVLEPNETGWELKLTSNYNDTAYDGMSAMPTVNLLALPPDSLVIHNQNGSVNFSKLPGLNPTGHLVIPTSDQENNQLTLLDGSLNGSLAVFGGPLVHVYLKDDIGNCTGEIDVSFSLLLADGERTSAVSAVGSKQLAVASYKDGSEVLVHIFNYDDKKEWKECPSTNDSHARLCVSATITLRTSVPDGEADFVDFFGNQSFGHGLLTFVKLKNNKHISVVWNGSVETCPAAFLTCGGDDAPAVTDCVAQNHLPCNACPSQSGACGKDWEKCCSKTNSIGCVAVNGPYAPNSCVTDSKGKCCFVLPKCDGTNTKNCMNVAVNTTMVV